MTKFVNGLDTLDGVAEEYRPAYAQGADGKFTIKPEFVPFTTAITGLNTSLEKSGRDLAKANKESADRRGAIQAYEDLLTAQGVSIEDGKAHIEVFKTYLDDLTSKAKNGGELKVSMANIQRDFEKKTKEIQDLADGKVTKMTKSLEKYLIGQEANAALAKAKGSVELLQPIIRTHVKMVQEGDDYVVRVVDAEGNVRTDGKGGFLTIEGLVAEMKTQPTYARAFESEAAGGSGARSNTKQTPGQRPAQERDKMTSTQKIAAGLAKGQVENGLGRRKVS